MSGFPCPYCGAGSTAVRDSRVRGASTVRRRECASCEVRFATVESTLPEDVSAIVAVGVVPIMKFARSTVAALHLKNGPRKGKLSIRGLARRAGISSDHLVQFARGTAAKLNFLEPALEALGYEVILRKRDKSP